MVCVADSGSFIWLSFCASNFPTSAVGERLREQCSPRITPKVVAI